MPQSKRDIAIILAKLDKQRHIDLLKKLADTNDPQRKQFFSRKVKRLESTRSQPI